MQNKSYEKESSDVTIFGIIITNCCLDDGIRRIEELIKAGKPKQIILANAHTLNLACETPGYSNILKGAGLILRDGTGVAWAMKKKGVNPLHNFVGTDFIPDFCRRTADKGYKIFLLGAELGVSEDASRRLQSIVPGIVISGCHNGFFAIEETDKIIGIINKAKPDILLVAMGNPKQELWIAENIGNLNVPVCIGVGALFDYLSGRVKRAPSWMLKTGMEWIFRIIVEPKRLWKRYIIGNPKFIIRVYLEILSKDRFARIQKK